MMAQTATAREAAEWIIRSGEAALLRWSPSNPMRPTIERQVAEARRELAA